MLAFIKKINWVHSIGVIIGIGTAISPFLTSMPKWATLVGTIIALLSKVDAVVNKPAA
jgi:hypothetical protein